MLEIDKMLISSASKSHCLLLLCVFELCPDALATSLDGPFRWWEIQCSLTTLVRIRASHPPGRWAIPFLEHPVQASNQLTIDPCTSPKKAAVPGPDWAKPLTDSWAVINACHFKPLCLGRLITQQQLSDTGSSLPFILPSQPHKAPMLLI